MQKLMKGRFQFWRHWGTAMLGYRVGDEFEWHVPSEFGG
jgi:hypothetical protein